MAMEKKNSSDKKKIILTKHRNAGCCTVPQEIGSRQDRALDETNIYKHQYIITIIIIIIIIIINI